MPHRMQVQQVFVPVAEGAVHIIDIGNFAYAILVDQALECEGVDRRFIDSRRIAAGTPYAVVADCDAKASDIAGD